MSPAGRQARDRGQEGKGFKKVKTLNAKRGKVFKTTLKLKGKQKLRAKVGGESSNVWKQK